MTNTRPTENGWYWYWTPGMEPEVIHVEDGVGYDTNGIQFRVDSLTGKWSERLEVPEAMQTK